MTEPTRLARKLSFPVLVLYGLGTTIGAGIYALVGEVAGAAGSQAGFAFGIAAVLAAFTALSFCELSSRLPRAGGEAVYVGEGFGSPHLARIVGLAIALAACVSAATVTRGFIGYASPLLPLPDPFWIALLLVALGALAAWGIGESVAVAGLLTVVEAGGLLWVIAVCGDSLATLPERAGDLVPALDGQLWLGVGGASLLCFYAYLGFEDMVSLAEEVRDARRALPRAIITTLAITASLYLVLVTVAVLTVSPEELAASDAPLALLFERATGGSALPIRVIGVLAMINGALIQIIRSIRTLYGLADRGELPAQLALVHPRTRTPLLATGLTVLVTMTFALALPIGPLARLTSAITLCVFAFANAALLQLKRRGPAPPGSVAVPVWIPVAGLCSSTALLLFELGRQLAVAVG